MYKYKQTRKNKKRISKKRNLKGGVTTTGGEFIQLKPNSMEQYFTNPAGGISYGGKKQRKTKRNRKSQKGGQWYNCLGGWLKNITNNSST